jgi:hypothetical protein
MLAMTFWKRFWADLYLGYRAVIAHPLRRLFRRDSRTPQERFLANYATEGLVPLSNEDRRVLRGASRCIHCGLCDAFDAGLSTLPRTAYDGASLLPVAYARATPDLVRARLIVVRLKDEQLREGERVCPTRVPLAEIARYLQRKLEELSRQKALPAEGSKA